jgi:hypothetical protein
VRESTSPVPLSQDQVQNPKIRKLLRDWIIWMVSEAQLLMFSKPVFELVFWVILALANIGLGMLLGATLMQSLLNILTIIPIIWIVVTIIEILTKRFADEDQKS